ncbi:hypothetical protein M3603_05810 [Rummeliibacillus stabekisii]|uniref:hypothetical protein n=1 Tax=Rummeliibacillus stabekisii TaxID=241244 RepID=UPI00203E69BB|nr:hypothetical protein [Rummeliibacillus stabekisii]MCM3316188.1 hypothetical protein [Rummeliibacillus stabekisii]
MAEVYKFFNSAPGDERWYYASDFAQYFSSVLSSGLLPNDNNEIGLDVKVEPGTLSTNVSVGKAIIKGYSYENTTNLTLKHQLPEATLNRIDRIVLRLDLKNANRFIKLFVIAGEPAAAPKAPELTRDQYIYEIALAQILVRANTSSLLQSDIIDERANESVCGIVQSLVTVPTSVFQQQFNTWFATYKNAHEGDFDDWFATLQKVLDENAAGNLLNLINNHIAEDATITNKGHTQLVGDIDGNSNSLVPTQNAVRKKIEQTEYKITKSGKDSNGIFTTVQYRRKSDNTLAAKSVLSGGTSPKYTTRTLTYYGIDGTTVENTIIKTMSYDADGDLISEV